jgi:hypothetical protein
VGGEVEWGEELAELGASRDGLRVYCVRPASRLAVLLQAWTRPGAASTFTSSYLSSGSVSSSADSAWDKCFELLLVPRDRWGGRGR